MIYKFLYEKYLINEMVSISKENSIFSTRLIFSSEVTLNVLSFLYFLFYHNILKIDVNKFYIESIVIGILFGLLVGFIFVKKQKLIDQINKNLKSNPLIRTIAILYTLLTFYIFIVNIKNVI